MASSPNDFSKVIEENRRLVAQNKKLQEELQALKKGQAETKKAKEVKGA